MNKRDLIKALFKNPTIKALYESGHFDASDINRAILMEANDENSKENEYYLEELKKQVKELKKQFDEVAAKAAKVKGEKSAAAAKPLVAQRKQIRSQIKELESEIARLVTKDIAITKAADKTATDEDDKVAGAVSVEIADRLEKLQFSVKRSSGDIEDGNVEKVLGDIKASISDITPYIEKEQDAVKTAQAAEKPDSEKTAKLTPVAQGWKNAKNSIKGAIERNDLTREEIEKALINPEKFKQVFKLTSKIDAQSAIGQVLAIMDTDWLKDILEQAKQKQQQDETFEIVPYMEKVATTVEGVMSFVEYMEEMTKSEENKFNIDLDRLKNIRFPKTVPTNEKEFGKFIIDAFKNADIGPSVVSAMGQDADSQTQGLEDELQKKYEAITADIIEKKPELFTNEDLQVTGMRYFIGWYADSVAKNPINENALGTFQGMPIKPESEKNEKRLELFNKYEGPGKDDIANYISSNKLRWENIFDTLEQMTREGQLAISTSTDTSVPAEQTTDGQTDDSEPTQQQDVKPEAREEKLLTVQPQQKEALQQKADPKADEDLGALEQEELDSSWKLELDTFFGKNPEASSFMRKLLLRDQAVMLYSMIATLDKIILGKREPEDVGQQAALTDQYDEDQPKQGNLEEQVINEVFSALFGKKEENEPVELSKESRGHMRQDLEAMVSLLRSLKEDIRGYSKYATRSSVDPRFDGSTLKKAMDAKLAVVQERIAMLTEQIKTSISQQDKQVAADAVQNLEEVMDLLSEADESDRRMKIKRVREVYEEMRRLYIDGLMTSLENNEPQKSKEGAKRIKDYVMEQEDFLSFFPSNIVSGGTVMTLGDAYESMKAIIGKFIDTIRDVVTITKTQNVSKESLALASRDLIGIAEAIEKMFKIPSKIDSDFVKKYKEAAASDPNNQSITNEKPQEDGADSDTQDVDMLGFIKDWFSNKASQLAGKVSEEFLKALANGFKGKGLNVESEEGKKEAEQVLELVQKPLSWFETLDEGSKNALSKLVDHLISELGRGALSQVNLPANIQEEISDEERGKIGDFTNRVQSTFGKSLEGRIAEFLNITDENTKSLLIKIMSENIDDLIKYLSSIFKIKEDLGDDVAEEVANAFTDTKGIPAKAKGESLINWSFSDYPNAGIEEMIHHYSGLSDDEIGIKTDGSSMPVVGDTTVKSIAENFGVNFTKDIGLQQHEAIVAIAKIVRILTKDKEPEKSSMEESLAKFQAFRLKNTIKKKFKKLSKVDHGYYLTSNLSVLLQEVDLSKESREGLIRLVDSIIRHKGDMKEVAKESKNYYTSRGSFGQTEKSDAKDKVQTIADQSPQLEESLKPIIEAILKEQYNH